MRDRNLALFLYYIADCCGNGWVENGHMVNCLRRMNGEAEMINHEDLSAATLQFSNGAQRPLREGPNRLIEDDNQTTGPPDRRGFWQITAAGRAEAETLLGQVIT